MAKRRSQRGRKRGKKSSRSAQQGAAQEKVIQTHQPQSTAQIPQSQPAGQRLSLCMIVRNEEAALPNCLASAQGLIDELIVVDTGSTDRTVEIAQRFGAKVYHFEWIDDFSAARNESIKHATGDWILWLDADDIFPEKYHATIRSLLASPKDHAFYFRLENVGGDEAECYQLRMYPNTPGINYTMPVHEQILPSLIQLGVDKIINLEDVAVIHTGYTDAETIAAKNVKYLQIMDKWLEAHPEDSVTRSHVARTHHTEGRHEQAIREYHTVINDDKCLREHALIYIGSLIYLGRSYLSLKDYSEAVSAFEAALNVEADYDIAYMCLGETYTRMGESDKAIEFLEKIRDKGGIKITFLPVEVKSLTYYSRHFLGQNYESKNRLDEAIAEYRAAIQFNPRLTKAPTALAQLFANQGNMSEAHRVLDQAVQANPDEVENYLNHVVLYLDEQRYDEAEQALQTALKQDATHSRAHFQQGQLYRLRGNLEAAEGAYQKAVEYNPDSVRAHTDLGHLYIERKQFDKAESAFEAAIQACKKKEQAGTIDVQIAYAYSCACNHHHEKVLETYQEVSRQLVEVPTHHDLTEIHDGLTDLWLDLGQVLLDNRLPKMAEYSIQTAGALGANSDRIAEGLGDVLMRTGKYAEAREQYESVLQLAPHRKEIFFKLGDCYHKLDAKDVAQMCYQQGVAANPLLNRTREA